MPSDSSRIFKQITPDIQLLIDNSISSKLATAGVEISSGDGISLSPSTITNVGTISLDAELNDLNGVSLNSLATDQILAYNGTSWINKAFPGLSGTSFRFVDLLDVDFSLGLNNYSNYLVSVNSTGTSIVPITNNYINNVNAGAGIRETKPSDNTLFLELDPSTVIIDPNPDKEDYLIYHKTLLGARRSKISSVNLSSLNDDLNVYNDTNLVSGNAIDFTVSGDITSIGVCTAELEVNFNAGVCGVLPLAHGGTSASTSASARDFLGLEYNRDILPVSGPSFTGLMYGDNISLLPSSFGLSLITGGSGYSNGNIILINQVTNEHISTGISYTVTSGIITSPTHTSLSIRSLNLLDYTNTYSVLGGNNGASYSVVPDPFNIYFGGSTTETAVGLRNKEGILEVKSSRTGEGASWQTIFPLGLSRLIDVNLNSVLDNDILIYDGTSFTNAPITGNSKFTTNFNYTGTSIVLSINPLENSIGISALDSDVTKTEFDYLEGVSSNIQNQLNSKIGVCPNFTSPADGDLVYYENASWKILRNTVIGTCRIVLGISVEGSLPSYNHLQDFTLSTSSYDWSNDKIFTYKNIDEPAYSIEIGDILKDDNLCLPTGGLEIDSLTKKLKLDLSNLSLETSFNDGDDLILFHDSLVNDSRVISLSNTANYLAGTGLSSISTGKINLNTEGVSALTLKLFNNGTSLVNQASPSTYDHSLASYTNASGGSSLAFSNGTSWYEVLLGNYIS